MKRLFVFLLFLMLSFKFFAQSDIGYVFVIKIAPSWYGLVTFYQVFYDGKGFSESEILTKTQFIRQIQGKEKSWANPNKENLLKKYGIRNPGVIDSLWKLRFAVYPYKKENADTLGWTENFQNPFVPKPAQKQILAQMGMDTVFYTIFGENLFNLLKAMNDPRWIAQYKNAQ